MQASKKTAARLKHGNMWVINEKMIDRNGDPSVIQVPVAAYPAYEVQGYRKYTPAPAEPTSEPKAVKAASTNQDKNEGKQIQSPETLTDGKAVDSNKQGDGAPVSRYPGGKK